MEGNASPDLMLWEELDRRVVLVTTWVATVFALGIVAVGLAQGNPPWSAMNPGAVALTGWVMLAVRRPNVAIQLAVGMIALILTVAFIDIAEAHDPLLGVLAIGVAGILFARRYAVLFAAAGTASLAVVAFLHSAGQETSVRAQAAFGAAAAFVFIAWLLLWMKGRWLDSGRRLQDLIYSKDQLVASVSHELRTPMTSVVGLARELDDRFEDFDPAEVRELISLIVHESTDVANILEDLLVAARTDVGNLALDLQPVDIYGEIETSVVTVSNATIQRHDGSEQLEVVADAGRVRQILRNLIVNATRYGGPKVRVAVVTDHETVEVSVCDDGKPIPIEDRAKIFQPYQGAGRSQHVPGSVGLGLTVSRQLARLMGGDLVYDHDGEQSRFTLSLPRRAERNVRHPLNKNRPAAASAPS